MDKVSIDEAIEKVNKDNEENIEVNIDTENFTNNDENISQTNNITENNVLNTTTNNINNVDNKYVTTYDAGTQSYVVYSTAELIKSDAPKTLTENEKINGNKDLISYYTNLSTSKSKLKDTGIIIISLIVASICAILVVLYKKTNR